MSDETRIAELEKAVELLLNETEPSPSQDTYLIEDSEGGLVPVSESFANAIDFANKVLYGNDDDDAIDRDETEV